MWYKSLMVNEEHSTGNPNLSPDVVDALKLDKVKQAVYTDLALAILKRAKRPLKIRFEGQEDFHSGSKESTIDTTIRVLAETHNELARSHKTGATGEPLIVFESQEHYDLLSTGGLAALSPEQARVALEHLQFKDRVTEVTRGVANIILKKQQEAKSSGNLAQYMMWKSATHFISEDFVSGMGIYMTEDGSIPDPEKFVDYVIESQPSWQAEAKMVYRLEEMLKTMPDEEGKVKVALARLPKEIDQNRPVRIMVQFPTGTYKGYGGRALETNDTELFLYSGPDAPVCVQDAYYRLYTLTRVKNGEKYLPRPFYIRSMVFEGVEGQEDFPEAARQYLELSFADGSDPILPPVVKDLTKIGVTLLARSKSAIDDSDLDQIVTDEDGLAHFKLGVDAQGYPIRQDTVQYAMRALLGGYSNVKNFLLNDFV